jgi:hypothetical protein
LIAQDVYRAGQGMVKNGDVIPNKNKTLMVAVMAGVPI